MHCIYKMDFRPVDTLKTISTRNLIRSYALTNLFLVLVYTSIEPYFNGANVSWIHQLHLILQPLAIFASIADSSILTGVTLIFSFSAIIFDGVVLWLNFIAVSRCIAEPSATCFEMVFEKFIWGMLAFVHIFSDTMLSLRLISLRSYLVKKDVNEKIAIQNYDGEVPILKTVDVNCAKLRILHVFLLPIGFLYSFFMLGRTFSNLLWIGALIHVFVDLYGISVSRVHDTWSLGILMGLQLIIGSINLFTVVYRIPEPRDTISEDLSFYISIFYIFADCLLLYFIIATFRILQGYEKLKKS